MHPWGEKNNHISWCSPIWSLIYHIDVSLHLSNPTLHYPSGCIYDILWGIEPFGEGRTDSSSHCKDVPKSPTSHQLALYHLSQVSMSVTCAILAPPTNLSRYLVSHALASPR
jgi:hypothetical protein